jgi:hypothetical protein
MLTRTTRRPTARRSGSVHLRWSFVRKPPVSDRWLLPQPVDHDTQGVAARLEDRAMTEPTTRITTTGDRIQVERLELVDAGLARFVEETPEADRATLAERALRIGLLAICNAGVSVNVDVVRAEFGRLVEQMTQTNERAAVALEQVLRANFADGEGRLPRAMEAYLGDSGKLNRLVAELFDENRRGSAIGRLQQLLGRYFDGDGSQLAQLLDPTRQGSPLYQFRSEVTGEFRKLSERIAELEAGTRARAEERSKGTAKGVDFEDAIEARLTALAHGAGDLLERTATDAGDALRSKKGDFVLTVDPSRTRGASLRVVIEAKDRATSGRRFAGELAEARENRGAAVALAVFTPPTAPNGTAPLALFGNDVYCTYDPEADDTVALEAAFRLARLLALASLRDAAVQLDVDAVQAALDDVRRAVGEIQSMKTRLTGISTAAGEVTALLDGMKLAVLRGVKAIEEQLRVVEDGTSGALTA